ncbi:peptidase domain-containing ABC transporter [Vibrio sagamiensis]|uniref:peptidase domain-containing ABC transporter n=1 Tax=Vibrio sagamiensis TaxID=512650 RepID=UPI001300C14D|nr:peptidase domain-containing ABC transporter [Vibrio sagamiensis]
MSYKTPLILQSETNECGLACIAMLSCYFGKRIDLSSTRHLCGTANQGMTLRQLIHSFERIGMTAHASRTDIDDIKSLKQPIILHWSFNHFVVLIKANRKGAIIHDPAIGRRHISLQELSDHFTGIIIEAWPTEAFDKKPIETNVNVSDLFQGIKGLGKILFGVIALSALIELLTIAVPAATQFTIDTLIKSSDTEGVIFVTLLVISALLIKSIFSVVRAWVLMNVRYTLGVKWSEKFFNRLIKLKLPFFEKRHTGDVASRFQSLTAIQDTFTADLIASVLDAFVIIISIILMFTYSPILALGPCIAAASYVLLKICIFPNYRARKIEHITSEARQSSHFLETVRAIAAIKMSNLASVRRREWINHVVTTTHSGNQLFKLDLFTKTIGVLLGGFSAIYVLGFGAVQIDEGMTAGILLAIMLYAEMVVSRSINLVDAVSDFCLVSMHSQRLTDIAVSPIEKDIDNAPVPTLNGNIIVNNLSFRYSDSEPDIFSDISLEIKQGESIAIIGPSGCGKSTFLQVLAGFYEPTGGQVLINGINTANIKKSHLRDHIAFVMQDEKLLAGSIKQNITGFSEYPNSNLMLQCSSYAAINNEIESLPQAYESMIGDIGNTLSGGQKQRISIARALYREPNILLLDEATSDLDIANEKKITNSISQLPITRVFVAHRPEMIMSADRIFDISSKQWTDGLQWNRKHISSDVA